jgi:hypothetical protein
MPEPLHQPRPQSLADLDKVITEAEQARDRRREVLRHLPLGQDLWSARMMLELAEERVAQLHHSREVLLRGVQSPHVKDEADAP